MVKSEKITKQIAGTMAIEGMRLNNKELFCGKRDKVS